MLRKLYRHCALGLILAATALPSLRGKAQAETRPAGFNVDHRVIVAVEEADNAVQSLLPEGWVSFPFPDGPVQGANILFVFVDSLLQLDGEGTPLSPPTRRALVLVGLGREADDDEVRLYVLRIYTTTPEVDPYGVNVAADISRETVLLGPANGARKSIEEWQINVPDGGKVQFRLSYATGTRNWGPDEIYPHSASDSDFYRIYRIEQMVDLVESVPMGKASSGEMTLASDVPELKDILDGSEQIVAVMDVPVYVRRISLP
jgi:hypothetical protein